MAFVIVEQSRVQTPGNQTSNKEPKCLNPKLIQMSCIKLPHNMFSRIIYFTLAAVFFLLMSNKPIQIQLLFSSIYSWFHDFSHRYIFLYEKFTPVRRYQYETCLLGKAVRCNQRLSHSLHQADTDFI